MVDVHWKARVFAEDDFDKASALRKIFLDPNTSSIRRSCEPEYYRWKILKNPLQQGIFHVAEDNGKVVGMTTVTPKRLRIFGRSVLGAEIGDTFTHPDYQRQGIFSTLVNLSRGEALQKGMAFIYGTPNDNSLPGYEKKLDFLQIPSPRVHSLVRPLNIKAVLKARFSSSILANGLAPLVAVFFGLRYKLRPSGMDREGIQFEEIDSFPGSVGVLWETVCSKYDWILERGKTYLDWRFIANPDSYGVLSARDSRNMLGYLVTKLGRWRDLRVGYLADFLTIENEPQVFEGLIYQAVEDFVKANADMVACWCVADSFYDRILRAKGFRVHEIVPIICYRKTDIGTEVLTRNARWHFTMSDSDNI